MNILRLIVAAALLPLAVQLPPASRAADQPSSAPKPLFDMRGTASLPASGVAPTSAQVTVTRSPDPATPGLVVTIQPGKEGYPGLTLKPPGGLWNLSAFGRVEARVVNTEGHPAVVGEFRAEGAARTITVYNHLDVQPATPSEWTHPPFTYHAEDGRYFARGATDDKGPALVALGSGMGAAGVFVAAMLAGMVLHDKFLVQR